jgi:hypothetical protein
MIAKGRVTLLTCALALLISRASRLYAATNAIDLATLNGTNGFRLTGVNANDRAGFVVSGAGDCDGDRFDDLIVVADQAATNRGVSHVVLGHGGSFAASTSLSTVGAGTSGFTITGATSGNKTGTAASKVGDINGDGIGDVLLGTPNIGPVYSRTGAAYLVLGKSTPANVALATLGNGTSCITGEVGNATGDAVSDFGDFNGDGLNDVALGAGVLSTTLSDGRVYLVLGRAASFPSNSVHASYADGVQGYRFDGTAGSRAGSALAFGDLNGDGRDDLLIGTAGQGSANRAYVVLGRQSGLAAGSTLNSTFLNGTNGVILSNTVAQTRIHCVESAGDIRGDGFDAVVIGTATTLAYGGITRAFVVFGKTDWAATPTLNLGSLDGTNGFALVSNTSKDNLGLAVSGAGDVNGDGFSDLVIGAPGFNVQAGTNYVVFGHAGVFPAALDLSSMLATNGLRLDGDIGDKAGQSVSAGGDVNGDGFDDVIVGAPSLSSAAGAAYVVFGANFAGDPNTVTGDVTHTTVTGTAPGQHLVSGSSSNTVLNAGSLANSAGTTLRGGGGDDTLKFYGGERYFDGGRGIDTLQFAGTNQILDLPALAAGRVPGAPILTLHDIERIDMRGGGTNELRMNPLNLLRLSDSTIAGSVTGHVLYVQGDAADRVTATQAVWWASGLVNFEGVNYQHFLVPNTTGHLLVEDGMDTSGIGLADTDGDGMPDWWVNAYFGGATNAAAGADPDRDGAGNLAEYLAGTNPTNDLSVLKFHSLQAATTNLFVVEWGSVSNRIYDLLRATNLAAGFTPLVTNLPAHPPMNTYTDAVGSVPAMFYRIRLR